MTYSCSDFTDDVLNCLASAGAIDAATVPADSPGDQSDMAIEAIVKMQRSVLASRFTSELLAGVESVSAIADQHGVAVLAVLFYLPAAINNEIVAEIDTPEMGAVELIRTLPSADEWMKHIQIVRRTVLLNTST
ncbi:hypothetical protein R69658_06546 [Paraburkholderia aspalathi]|uniref:Uncharacterized protein n=2 Tax=Paraburkholderia aspalathi TaxID=1324617 RepID=A0ABM8SW68_9BURK|nr:hypothetical protein R69658_06546 [Paraburkholderia aspalathi]